MNDYYEVQLKNDMLCKFYSNNSLHSITIGLYIKSGLIYEDKNCFGISHLLEHLFFRKLHDLTQKDLYYLMESIGTTLKGITYADCICFRITILPQYFNIALEILCKIFKHNEWTFDDIKKEKRVVLNQIEYQYWDDFYKYMDRIYFMDTNLENKIIGNKSVIKRLSKQKINDFKNMVVNPQNSCIVITGNFLKSDMENTINIFEDIRNHGIKLNPKRIIPMRFCARTEEDNVIDNVEWETSEVFISFDCPNDINIYCINLLSSIIGDGDGSKLSLILREDLGFTNEVSSKVDNHCGFRRLTIKFMLDNNSLIEALENVFRILKDIKKNVSDKEFLSSIVFYTENKNMLYDDTYELNSILGYNAFIESEKVTDINSMISKYQKINIIDLENTANRLFLNTNLFIAVGNNKNIVKNSKIKKVLSELRKSLSETHIQDNSSNDQLTGVSKTP